ncbi:MAG TPA: dihydrolipoyl dehydrogenase, partial [Chitinispirillaceae bacterium]|nr:dihydrolipoyl dehydrogenase [Chitinispirillaceae bacterium]
DVSGFDYSKVYAASRKAADTLSKGVAYLLKKNGVTVITGTAVLESKNELLIDGVKKISAQSIIVATGSRPRPIPGFEFDENMVLSSNGALLLQSLPKSILIMGGGAIGVEFAHIMNSFGVKVHLVELMERILPSEDTDISDHLKKSFIKRGIEINTGTKAISMHKKNDTVVVTLDKNGELSTVEVEKVLVVVGRIPNTVGLGLEKLGVELEKGFVKVGKYNETSVQGIYAIGDVVATPLLAHVASKEGEIAVEHIAGDRTVARLDKNTIPGAVYCEPQVASFGYTEAAAKQRGLEFQVATFPYKGVGKSVAVGKSDGFLKLVFDSKTHEILGAHIIGSEATELLHEILLAKYTELLPEDVATMIHAHPTMSEGVMELCRAAEGWAIHI